MRPIQTSGEFYFEEAKIIPGRIAIPVNEPSEKMIFEGTYADVYQPKSARNLLSTDR